MEGTVLERRGLSELHHGERVTLLEWASRPSHVSAADSIHVLARWQHAPPPVWPGGVPRAGDRLRPRTAREPVPLAGSLARPLRRGLHGGQALRTAGRGRRQRTGGGRLRLELDGVDEPVWVRVVSIRSDPAARVDRVFIEEGRRREVVVAMPGDAAPIEGFWPAARRTCE